MINLSSKVNYIYICENKRKYLWIDCLYMLILMILDNLTIYKEKMTIQRSNFNIVSQECIFVSLC